MRNETILFEKVNPAHPDKIADRIAGALVDYAYNQDINAKCAIEVLIGHRQCTIVIESNIFYVYDDVKRIVDRIAGPYYKLFLYQEPQDEHLADNQKDEYRCGDNGIFRGMPVSYTESRLTEIAEDIYDYYKSDGKYIMTPEKLIICQSNADEQWHILDKYDDLYNREVIINPLGFWTGGCEVDSGCTNRKLGSDMGRAVTGGGLHGKDLSKADVTVNIYCHILAQIHGTEVQAACAIGDESVVLEYSEKNKYGFEDRISERILYKDMVNEVWKYIQEQYGGSFENLAEWGLIK